MDFTQPWTSFTGLDLYSVLMAIELKIRSHWLLQEGIRVCSVHETHGKCWLSNEAIYCPAPYVDIKNPFIPPHWLESKANCGCVQMPVDNKECSPAQSEESECEHDVMVSSQNASLSLHRGDKY